MDQAAQHPSFFARTFDGLAKLWRQTSAKGDSTEPLKISPYLHEEEQQHLLALMHDCLTGRGGEVSARHRAVKLGETYLLLNAEGRQKMLQLLATRFPLDREAINDAVVGLFDSDTPGRELQAAQTLRNCLRPAHLRLLTQFNALPQGVKFLVDMRADLITCACDDPALQALDDDLKRQLKSWFDVGFLELRQITWDASASTLEKLIHYEAVHRVSGWDDLKNRLAEDRRCFAFFHPQMPDEPLIFVWVALLERIADNVQAILDPERPTVDPETANTAIFYSISSTQAGLAGVNLGDFLIKRVVEHLKPELPALNTFSTLSPIPGFRRWAQSYLRSAEAQAELDAAPPEMALFHAEKPVAEWLTDGDWLADAAAREAAEAVMVPLCARYLCEQKRKNGASALDPVAHFHLSNGARVHQINRYADRSERGIAQSYGLMVNYLYQLDAIEDSHEDYVENGIISMSDAVKDLLPQSS
ncbi:MAG: malonyl-CoA decarboxylase [Pseudomonadota bacterium]